MILTFYMLAKKFKTVSNVMFAVGNMCHICTFIFTARRNARTASAVLAMALPSVCLSVCHRPILCQNDGT